MVRCALGSFFIATEMPVLLPYLVTIRRQVSSVNWNRPEAEDVAARAFAFPLLSAIAMRSSSLPPVGSSSGAKLIKLAGSWIVLTAMTSPAVRKQTATAAANDLTGPFGRSGS